MQQTTNTILMIRPENFRANRETIIDNYFQKDLDSDHEQINKLAQNEFDAFVDKLRDVGITIIVVNDDVSLNATDSVFPNNWVSFHGNGDVAIYPMFSKSRRRERREDVFIRLEEEGFKINHIVDYTEAETEGVFLEGTGSMILDRVNRKAYCSISVRSDEDLFIEFCEDFEYTPIVFNAKQTFENKRLPIYHTNVMMCLGETFAIICLDAIDDKKERKNVLKHLKQDGKSIIAITEAQMHQFAGNMLELRGADDKRFLVMSDAAYHSLTPSQINEIEKHCSIIHSNLKTIETCGGGSARCMLAEVFLPRS